MPTKESKVVIIGACFSGMAAARCLTDARWISVTILEACDEIGGRVKTKPIGDSPAIVDCGAAWIHGAGTDASYSATPMGEVCPPSIRQAVRCQGRGCCRWEGSSPGEGWPGV
mmetsp:Transcript_44563/g.135826  ORF Transcript_44563/g.135826 Transcript_44563/m.135826 type:complete len:113 (-) Transcript_44563:1581-1919(-)